MTLVLVHLSWSVKYVVSAYVILGFAGCVEVVSSEGADGWETFVVGVRA